VAGAGRPHRPGVAHLLAQAAGPQRVPVEPMGIAVGADQGEAAEEAVLEPQCAEAWTAAVAHHRRVAAGGPGGAPPGDKPRQALWQPGGAEWQTSQ